MKGAYMIGQAVICNGYPGIVVRLTENGMVEVRLVGGVVCVDPTDDREIRSVMSNADSPRTTRKGRRR